MSDSESKTLPHRATGSPLKSLRVEVIAGPDKGRQVRASADTITVGTAATNDLVLTDPTVSRFHLELARRADRILVIDPGSTNGTTVGGAQIERGSIAAATVLSLGKTQLKVEDGEIVDVEIHDSEALAGIYGRSKEMRRLMATIERLAGSDVSALLIGETGTGKEVFAHALHQLSPRASGPFETVDCGSLMPTLIASELFGHERGAFTGADEQHRGAFERANGGTLFLDEIGELPASLQSTLLGALERRSFRRLGGKAPIDVDVRLVCATNRDLRGAVNAGTFRQDLYFRIAVVTVAIPPLRERASDIPLLVEHFLRLSGHDGPIEALIPGEVMQSLKLQTWPGNVRELRNFVEAVLATGEPSLPGPSRAEVPSQEPSGFPSVSPETLLEMRYKDARQLVVRELESLYFTKLLERTQNNVSEASRVSGMNRTYLAQMLKQHGIK